MASSSTPGTEPPPLTLRYILRVSGLAIGVGIGLGLFGFFSTLFAGFFIGAYARAAKQQGPHERTPAAATAAADYGLARAAGRP
jgi:uncharacterized membrane protein SpoIIM required for sporulation